MYKLGGFPAIVKGGNTSISMEVYKVDTYIKSNVDRLEGFYSLHNPNNFYDTISIPSPYGEAVTYIIDTNKHNLNGYTIINTGDWLKQKI